MKKLFALLLALCLGTALLPFASAEEGTAGEKLISGKWEFRILEDGTAEITRYKTLTGDPEDLVIPEELGGRRVTAIAPRALFWCETVRTVTIPDGITSIGGRAFLSCKNLEEVTIGNGSAEIGENLFAVCGKLTTIHLAPDHPCLELVDGVLFLKGQDWLYCYPAGLDASSYTIPQGTRTIGEWAFSTSRLENVTIPDSVSDIRERAFYECKNLAEATIPAGVAEIREYTFGECWSLAKVSIPDGVTAIGEQAFHNCKSLAGITIPDSVTSIGKQAFWYCDSLEEVTIPDSVTAIGDRAFAVCVLLKEVSIGNGVTSVGANPFETCPLLTGFRLSPDHPYLEVADGVLFIRNPRTLVCCPGGLDRKEYTIPADTQAIGAFAFSGARPEQVTVPDSVQSIGEYAFEEDGSVTLAVGRNSAAELYCLENELDFTCSDR